MGNFDDSLLGQDRILELADARSRAEEEATDERVRASQHYAKYAEHLGHEDAMRMARYHYKRELVRKIGAEGDRQFWAVAILLGLAALGGYILYLRG